MAPGKRASLSGSDAAAKRRKVHAVEEAIAEASGYSASVKNLLSNAVSDCLGIYKDERHEFQSSIVTMIGKVITSEETSLNQAIKDAEAKVAEQSDTHSSLTKAAEEKASELNAKTDAEKEAKNALHDSEEALKTLMKAVDEKLSFDAFSIKFKESCESGTAGHGRDMAKLGKELESADLLLDAVSSGFKKAQESRSTFEKYAIEELGKALTAKVSALGKVDTSEEAKEAAQSKKQAMTEALDAAKVAHSAAQKDKKDADDAAAKAAPALEKVKKVLVDANKSLEHFQEKAKAAFNELIDATTPPPPPEKEVASPAKVQASGLDAA